MEAGEPFDVIILSYDVEGLVKQGKLAADSRTVFGRSGIGVAVRRNRTSARWRRSNARC